MTQPTKLTLRLDSGLIEGAKEYAHSHQRSLSQLVADYFARLVAQPVPSASDPRVLVKLGSNKQLGSKTAALRGSWATASRAKGQTKSVGIDDYHVYLEQKHQ